VSTQTHVFARQPEHDVNPIFVNRWSPRSFTEDPVSRSTLDSMVEAARWAPSSNNLQPWSFRISNGPGPTRDSWNEAVNQWNRSWADKAPVLVWVVARTTVPPSERHPTGSANRHAHFDTGAATIQFVLEGERHGLKAHYMGGVDVHKAHQLLGLDADHEVVCAIAIGHPGPADALPEPMRAREHASSRKAHGEIATFA
jgi:nitroreductase